MTPKEQYDKIIYTIESLVSGVPGPNGTMYLSNTEISEKAFNESFYTGDNRSRNTLFTFLTGTTVNDYISQRKMMAAYKHLMDRSQWACPHEEIEIAAFGSQPAFIKKFKKTFGIIPSAAWKSKDYSLLIPPLDWDHLSKSREGEKICPSVTVLRQKYKLNDREINLAYRLGYQNGLPMDEVFEYIYNYSWQYMEGLRPSCNRDEYLEKDLLDPEVLQYYFTQGLGFDEIYRNLHKADLEDEMVMSDFAPGYQDEEYVRPVHYNEEYEKEMRNLPFRTGFDENEYLREYESCELEDSDDEADDYEKTEELYLSYDPEDFDEGEWLAQFDLDSLDGYEMYCAKVCAGDRKLRVAPNLQGLHVSENRPEENRNRRSGPEFEVVSSEMDDDLPF